MTNKVVPISDDVSPAFDAEREFIDWFTGHLRDFVAEHGVPDAMTMAIHTAKHSMAKTWSPNLDNPWSSDMISGLAIATLIGRIAGD